MGTTTDASEDPRNPSPERRKAALKEGLFFSQTARGWVNVPGVDLSNSNPSAADVAAGEQAGLAFNRETRRWVKLFWNIGGVNVLDPTIPDDVKAAARKAERERPVAAPPPSPPVPRWRESPALVQRYIALGEQYEAELEASRWWEKDHEGRRAIIGRAKENFLRAWDASG